MATVTLPPRLFTEDLLYHGVACSPSRLTLDAALHGGLAVLQGLHGLELPGRREDGRGHEGEASECQSCDPRVVLTVPAARPHPSPQHHPSVASSPPDVVDRGAEVMGPVGKSAVQAVFGAVAFGVRLVDADSSFVVA